MAGSKTCARSHLSQPGGKWRRCAQIALRACLLRCFGLLVSGVLADFYGRSLRVLRGSPAMELAHANRRGGAGSL